MRLVIVVLVALILYLQYGLWYTRGGKHDVDKLKVSVAEQKDEIARLKERNRSLSAEVMDLKQGLEAVEERARSEMGMIKNGEVFFRITDPKHGRDQVGKSNGLTRGLEAPLEPPLDPLAPGDAVLRDGPHSPAIAQDKPAAIKPMVKATAKDVAPQVIAPKPAVTKSLAKPASMAAQTAGPAKSVSPTSPLTTSKSVMPNTGPGVAPRAAPLSTQALRKPAAIE